MYMNVELIQIVILFSHQIIIHMRTGHALGLMTSGGWHGNRWARLTAPPLTCIKFVADSEREFCTHCYILLLLLYDYYYCWRNVANVDVVVICWCRVSQSVMFLWCNELICVWVDEMMVWCVRNKTILRCYYDHRRCLHIRTRVVKDRN